MRKAVTFTSTLSNDLFLLLNDFSLKLKMPKSQIINDALRSYINELKRQEYVKSFRKARLDGEIRELTDAGMDDFLELVSK